MRSLKSFVVNIQCVLFQANLFKVNDFEDSTDKFFGLKSGCCGKSSLVPKQSLRKYFSEKFLYLPALQVIDSVTQIQVFPLQIATPPENGVSNLAMSSS